MRSFVATLALLVLASAAPQQQQFHQQDQNAAAVVGRSGSVGGRTAPVAIVRSLDHAPGTPGFERSFDSSFLSENGIKQEVIGEMRLVGDSEVMVMRGSYEYQGDDAQTYVVDWYADETGFHPSAPHLPKNVEIPFPEQAAAVEAQVRFAEEQARSGKASDDGAYHPESDNDNTAQRTGGSQNNNNNYQAATQTRSSQPATAASNQYNTVAAAPARSNQQQQQSNNYQQQQQQRSNGGNVNYVTLPAPISPTEVVQVRAASNNYQQQQTARAGGNTNNYANQPQAFAPLQLVEVRQAPQQQQQAGYPAYRLF